MVVVHEENIDLEDSKIRMTLDEGDIAHQATKDLAGIMEQTPELLLLVEQQIHPNRSYVDIKKDVCWLSTMGYVMKVKSGEQIMLRK